MAWLYTHPRFLDHKTGNHPETHRRLERIVQTLQDTETWRAFEQPSWNAATSEQLARLHDAKYIQRVQAYAERGGGRMESDTVVSGDSFDVACLAAGAVMDAVRRVVGGSTDSTEAFNTERRAVCLVRPPGHHALPHAPMGFCLFNNVALGALTATRELELQRVLIVDWDVHHGNGTQDAFWTDPQVAFLSIHRSPFYPGTGAASETGAGSALGTKLNVPVRFGTSRAEYRDLFRAALHKLAAQSRPELIIVSAGFDAHRLDPIGSLGLETDDYTWLTQDVLDVAQVHSQGRAVFALEGGYHLDELPRCVERMLRAVQSFG